MRSAFYAVRMAPPFASVVARLRRSPAIVVAVCLCALVGREAWRTATKDRDASPSLDVRFAEFAALARGAGRVGFIHSADDPDEAMTRGVELQYALAPVVLVTGVARTRLVVGWADRPERIDALATTNRLRTILRTPDGFALFEQAGP